MREQLSANDLATHYLNITNTALVHNRDHFPYKQIIELMNAGFSGETISIRVVDEAGNPLDFVTTQFAGGQFTPPRPGVHDPDAKFSLRRDYLQQVVDNADEYIEHPARLDWSWLTDQLEPVHDSHSF